MRNIFNILKVFVKHWYRRKSTIFWTILFPVLLIMIFGSIFGNMGSSKMTLYIQNQDTEDNSYTEMSTALINALNSTDLFDIHKVNVTQNLDEVLKGVSNPRALIIPKGFSRELQDAIRSKDNSPPKVILKRDTSQVSDPALGLINTAIRQFSTYLMVGDTRPLIDIQEEGGQKGFRYIDFFIPGVIGMSVMTTGLMGAVSINTEYRINGVLRKLATTPISKLDWVLGIVLYEMLIAFLSAAIIIGLGYLPISIFNAKISLNIYAVLMIVAGTLVFPGMGMILARFVKDPSTADAAANALAFPMMFLSGTFFPMEMYPDILKQIAQVLPLTYFNNGLRAAMVDNQLDIALTNMTIVMILAAISIIVGTLVTNWREK